MQTIRLNINEKVYDRLLWLLGKFGKDEVEIIPEDNDYAKTRQYLESELNEIQAGDASFIGIDQLEQRLTATINRRQDRIQK